MAARKNIKLTRGDDVNINVRISTKEPDITDWTGYRFDMQARTADDNLVLDLSSTNKSILRTNQGVKIKITHDMTEGVDWDVADYDLQVTDQDGNRTTILRGTITLIRDFTRGPYD